MYIPSRFYRSDSAKGKGEWERTCKVQEKKDKIDWKLRERELLKLLNKHRSKNGEYDCIVPGSGGKDSCFASHILKNIMSIFQLQEFLTFMVPEWILMMVGMHKFQFHSHLYLSLPNLSYLSILQLGSISWLHIDNGFYAIINRFNFNVHWDHWNLHW